MTALIERPAAPSLNKFWHFYQKAQIHYLHTYSKQAILTELSLEKLEGMNRIVILGSSGSGKSTLARNLGKKLGLPVIHLDLHYWNPGWEPTPSDEWQKEVQSLIDEPKWIIDGNYRSTLDMRLEACDAAIFLDMPPTLCVQRAIKRRFQYLNQPRPDITRGCKEHVLDPKFPQFIKHILNYPNRARPTVLRKLHQIKHQKNVFILRSSKDVADFLAAPEEASSFNPLLLEQIPAINPSSQITTD